MHVCLFIVSRCATSTAQEDFWVVLNRASSHRECLQGSCGVTCGMHMLGLYTGLMLLSRYTQSRSCDRWGECCLNVYICCSWCAAVCMCKFTQGHCATCVGQVVSALKVNLEVCSMPYPLPWQDRPFQMQMHTSPRMSTPCPVVVMFLLLRTDLAVLCFGVCKRVTMGMGVHQVLAWLTERVSHSSSGWAPAQLSIWCQGSWYIQWAHSSHSQPLSCERKGGSWICSHTPGDVC